LAVPAKSIEIAVNESMAARPVVVKALVATMVEPVKVSVCESTVTVRVSAFATVMARLTWALEL
jgi:hypothetical protein